MVTLRLKSYNLGYLREAYEDLLEKYSKMCEVDPSNVELRRIYHEIDAVLDQLNLWGNDD